MQHNIRPVYVFDGISHELKTKEKERRREVRKLSEIEYNKAIEAGDMDRARLFAQRVNKLTPEMIEDSKKLLELMGIPAISSPGEGEAQAAQMAKEGILHAAGTQDYDALVFGSPRMLRNVNISGRRRLPGGGYKNILPEMFELSEVLRSLDLSQAQLVDLGILMGSDFNPDGFKGVGPKTALKFIKKYGTFEEILANEKKVQETDTPYEEIRKIFLQPNVTKNIELTFESKFDKTGIMEYLHKQHNFNPTQYENLLSKTERALKNPRTQTSLDAFF
jgi:flap endonuclease-1